MDRANQKAAEMLETLEGEDWLGRLAAGLAARTGADADDLAQRTRIAAWRRFGGLWAPRPWLAKVAKNAAREEARGARRRRDREASVAHPQDQHGGSRPDAAAEAIEGRRIVLDALDALPTELREVVVLRHLDGLSIAAVAEHTDSPTETVRSRLARARSLLRRDLERRCEGRPWLFALLLPTPMKSAAQSALVSSHVPPLMALMKAVHTIPVLLFVLAGVLVGGYALQAEEGLPSVQVVAEAEVVAGADALSVVRGSAEERTRVPAQAQLPAMGDPLGAPTPPPTHALSVQGLAIDLGGQPVRGARISAVESSAHGGPEVLSDEDGRFVWTFTQGSHRVRAAMDGYASVLDGNVHKRSSEDVLLVLAPSISIGGRTVDEQGQILPGVELRLLPPRDWSARLDQPLSGGTSRSHWTKSDELGRFLFEGVAALPDSNLWGTAPSGLRGLFRVPTEDRLDLVLTFKPKDRDSYRTTKFLLTRDGVTPRGGGVLHFPDWTAQADAHGAVIVPLTIAEEMGSFIVTEGGSLPWTVRLPMPSGAEGATTGVSTAPLRGEVAAGFSWLDGPSVLPDELVVELADQPAPGIRGVVVDTDGQPVDGASVWTSSAADSVPYKSDIEERMGGMRTFTDMDGSFHLIGLPGRTYTLRVCSRESFRSIEIDGVRTGEGTRRITLDTEPLLCEFRGRCVAADGTPLSGVTVRPLYAVGPNSWQGPEGGRKATSDAGGEFVVDGVPADVSAFQCEGNGVIPCELPIPRSRVSQGGPVAVRQVELTVPRRAKVRFDVRSVAAEAYNASLFDVSGRRAELLIFEWIPRLEMEGSNGTSWATFVDGMSPTYAAREGQYRAVLMGQNEEIIATMDVTLVPGEEPTHVAFE